MKPQQTGTPGSTRLTLVSAKWRLRLRVVSGFSLVCAMLAACTTRTETPTPVVATVDPGPIYTAAAQTFVAELTANAPTPGSDFTLTPSPSLPPPTFTPEPSFTPVPPTSSPTNPPPTQPPLPCNQAEFIRDISSTSSATSYPGEPFVKTWLIANTGSCAWNPGYSVQFISGSLMGDQTSFSLTNIVQPGESTAVNLILAAPENPGTARSAWFLRSDQGELFGTGPLRDEPLWVEIRVTEPPASYYYDFVNSYCAASWENELGMLPCPGDVSSLNGFILRLESADLESHREDEPLIWTQPSVYNNSWIRGTFPAIRIKDGDRFLADIGCLAGNPDCDVVFQLNYRIPGGVISNLGEWHEDADGRITRVNIDLSELAGRSIELILTTLANGPSNGDAAFWLMPHIVNR